MTGLAEESIRQRADRYKRYPVYKASGAEWLGDVPEHWGIRRLKRLVQMEGGGTPAKDDITYWQGHIPWVSPKDMKTAQVTETEDKITEQAVRESATKIIRRGALLVVVRSGILRHTIPVAILGCDAALNQDLKAFVPTSTLSPLYLLYLIVGSQRQLLAEWRKEGATVESLEMELVKATPVPLPPELEQAAITAFLDRQVAKIDALVSQKQRLVAALKKKRSALIARLVSKGLDGNVAMKSSAIDWLGEIPVHWNVKRVAECATVVNGYPFDSGYFTLDGGTPLVRIRDLFRSETEVNYDGPIATSAWIASGDIIIGMDGDFNSARWQGPVALLNQRLCSLRPYENADEGYLSYTVGLPLKSINDITHSTTVRHLSSADVRKFMIPVPPLREQREISSVLDRKTSDIDALITEVYKGTERLKEYRSALVLAAVTGRIDVREEA